MGCYLQFRPTTCKCPNGYTDTFIFFTDESFDTTVGLNTAISKIYGIMENNKCGRYLYGGSERINYQIRKYANVFGIPEEYMVPIDILETWVDDNRKEEYLANLITYQPSHLVVFSDNARYSIISRLVEECRSGGVRTEVISSSGDYNIQDRNPLHYSSQIRFNDDDFYIERQEEGRPDGYYRKNKEEL